MRFWLPYTIGNSGSDVSIKFLAKIFKTLGHDAVDQAFPHNFQYTPWILKAQTMPKGTDIVIGNSWNAFAFKRDDIPLITVERLFVLDNAYKPYKSLMQAVFHNSFLRFWLWRSYTVADSVVALSQNTASAIRMVFPAIEPKVIMNAVDTDFFSPAIGEKPSEKTFTKLLFVGNLSRRKGADMLAPILDELGDGYLLEYTQDRNSNRNGINHRNAHCIGRLDFEGVRKAYRRADLLLLPTRLEGLSRAAMESMSCGTPVISSDASSLPEVVIDGVSGFTCRTDNINSFASKIKALTRNKKQLSNLSQSARQYAEKNFDLKKMAVKYVELAEDLIRRRS